jgi:hypothetical protein
MRSPLGYQGTGRAGIGHAMRERDPGSRMAFTAEEPPYLSADGAVDPVREHVDDAYGWPRLDEAPIFTMTDAGISSMIFTGSVEAWVAFREGSREVADPIVTGWLTSWASQESDQVRVRYADDAVLVDSLVGVRLEGADQIAAAAAATPADGGLPGATLHEIPDGGGPASYGHGSDERPTPVYGDRRVLLVSVDEASGCPGDIAVAQWINDAGLITREERFHRVDSVRRCMDTGSLPPGWWETIELPDPGAFVRTGELQAGSQRIELWNGTAPREELLRSALARFAALGVPVPALLSATFAPEVDDPWAQYGFLPGEPHIVLPATAAGCPAQGCSPWPQAAQVQALRAVALSWLGEQSRARAIWQFAQARDMPWQGYADPASAQMLGLAADILVWGLMDQPYPQPSTLSGMTCDEIALAFADLTFAPTPGLACAGG